MSSLVEDREDVGFNTVVTNPMVYGQLPPPIDAGDDTVYVINTGRNDGGYDAQPTVSVVKQPAKNVSLAQQQYPPSNAYGVQQSTAHSYDALTHGNVGYSDSPQQQHYRGSDQGYTYSQQQYQQYGQYPEDYPTPTAHASYNRASRSSNPSISNPNAQMQKLSPVYSAALQGPSHLSEDELEKRYFASRTFADDPNLASTVDEALMQAKRKMMREEEEAARNAVVLSPQGAVRGGGGVGGRDVRVVSKADARLIQKDMNRAGSTQQQLDGKTVYTHTNVANPHGGGGSSGKSASMRTVGGYGGNGGVSGNVKKSHPYLRQQAVNNSHTTNSYDHHSSGMGTNSAAVALYTAHSMGIKPKRRARPNVDSKSDGRGDGRGRDPEYSYGMRAGDGGKRDAQMYESNSYNAGDYGDDYGNNGYAGVYAHGDGHGSDVYQHQQGYDYPVDTPVVVPHQPVPSSTRVPGVSAVLGTDMVDVASADTYFDLIEKLHQQAATPGQGGLGSGGKGYRGHVATVEPVPAELAAPPAPETTAVYQSMRPLPPPLVARNNVSGNNSNPEFREMEDAPLRPSGVTKNTPQSISHAYLSPLPEPIPTNTGTGTGQSVFSASHHAIVQHVNPHPSTALPYPVEPSPLLHNPSSSLSLLNNPRKTQREIEKSEQQKSGKTHSSEYSQSSLLPSQVRLRQAKEEEAARARERMWMEQIGEIDNGNSAVILNGSTLPGELEERARLVKASQSNTRAQKHGNGGGTGSGVQSRTNLHVSSRTNLNAHTHPHMHSDGNPTAIQTQSLQTNGADGAGRGVGNSNGDGDVSGHQNTHSHTAPPRFMQPKTQPKVIPRIPSPTSSSHTRSAPRTNISTTAMTAMGGTGSTRGAAIRGQKIVSAQNVDVNAAGEGMERILQAQREEYGPESGISGPSGPNSPKSGKKRGKNAIGGTNNVQSGPPEAGNGFNGGLRGDYSEYTYDDDDTVSHVRDDGYGGAHPGGYEYELESHVQSESHTEGTHMTEEEVERAAMLAAEEAYRQAMARHRKADHDNNNINASNTRSNDHSMSVSTGNINANNVGAGPHGGSHPPTSTSTSTASVGTHRSRPLSRAGGANAQRSSQGTIRHDRYEGSGGGSGNDRGDGGGSTHPNDDIYAESNHFDQSQAMGRSPSGSRTRTEPPTEAALRRERLLMLLKEQKEWEKTHKQTIIHDRKQQHENVVAFIKAVDVNDKQAAVQEVRQQHVALKEVVKDMQEQHRQSALMRKQEMKREAMKAKLQREKEKERERREEKEKEEAKFEALLRVMAEEKAVVAREYERLRSLERERETDNLKRRFANERFLKGGHVPPQFVHIAGGARAARPTSTHPYHSRNSNSSGSLGSTGNLNGTGTGAHGSPLRRGRSSRCTTPMEIPATLPSLSGGTNEKEKEREDLGDARGGNGGGGVADQHDRVGQGEVNDGAVSGIGADMGVRGSDDKAKDVNGSAGGHSVGSDNGVMANTTGTDTPQEQGSSTTTTAPSASFTSTSTLCNDSSTLANIPASGTSTSAEMGANGSVVEVEESVPTSTSTATSTVTSTVTSGENSATACTQGDHIAATAAPAVSAVGTCAGAGAGMVAAGLSEGGDGMSSSRAYGICP